MIFPAAIRIVPVEIRLVSKAAISVPWLSPGNAVFALNETALVPDGVNCIV